MHHQKISGATRKYHFCFFILPHKFPTNAFNYNQVHLTCMKVHIEGGT